MAERKRIRILIADDHLIVRMGLTSLFGLEKDLEVIGEASNGVETVRLAKDLHPDILVMDLRMPIKDGVDATREILASDSSIKVLILTAFTDGADIKEVMKAGATSALIKDTSRPELVAAIRKTAAGESVISREIRKNLDTTPEELHLSPRQREIVQLVAKGFNNVDIARILGVSRDCVKTNLKTIFARLGAASRTELAVIALHSNLVKL